ncbi:hypothetical protein BUALT_Bualt01G0152400 [Buddleja alternifolia]|uniref:Response regulatory domain-containing protein n=1 Tax=Buddleja alternifolia TaxID=168488 RepID=A0AAV6YFW0_9LAMI|nr:hypothetical protein BUALT_Bualt01G0152400 [Buddleja alternifolia]
MADEQENDFPVSYRGLIVTSGTDFGFYLEDLLRQCKFTFKTTGSEAEALALLKKKEDKFEFVICDGDIADTHVIRLVERLNFNMGQHVASHNLGEPFLINFLLLDLVLSSNVKLRSTASSHGAFWCFNKPSQVEDIKKISGYLNWRTEVMLNDIEIKEDQEYEDILFTKKPLENFCPFELMPKDDVWPVEVFEKFVAAFKLLAPKETNSGSVMKLMNVEGLAPVDVENQLTRCRLQRTTRDRIFP